MADASNEEYPNKEWSERLYKGWLVAKESAEKSIHDAMTDESISNNTVARRVNSALQQMIAYIQAWHRDAVTNRGLQQSNNPTTPPQAGDTHENRSMSYLLQARKRLEKFIENPASEYSVDNAVQRADLFVQTAVKEFGKIEYQWDESAVPQELDLYGMRLVFDDSYDPTRREFMVRYADEAYQILKQKKLDWLWYGILHVGAGESKGVRKGVGAWYMPGKDQFGIEQSRNAARNLAHEVGHRFWYKYMTETERAEFASKFGDVPAVTSYGKTDPEEDFAEVFAEYVDGQDLTQPQIERFRKFLDSHKKRHSNVVATLRSLISSRTP